MSLSILERFKVKDLSIITLVKLSYLLRLILAIKTYHNIKIYSQTHHDVKMYPQTYHDIMLHTGER